MKTTKPELRHVKGSEAYKLYWKQIYECRPRIAIIEIIDRNLELITDADQTILAYRHDPPGDMTWMVINAGHWQIIDEEDLSDELKNYVKEAIVRVSYDGCLN